MLLQKITQASHRYLALLGVLCMLGAQATAAVHSCGQAAASSDTMIMHGDHSGHDMAAMMNDAAGPADCCDQDCQCPDASCSTGAAMIVASIEIDPALGSSTPLGAAIAAVLPSQSHHFRPPIIA